LFDPFIQEKVNIELSRKDTNAQNPTNLSIHQSIN